MASSNLVSEITKLSKQKMIPASVVDSLGLNCSVRLSTNGKLLTNLKYFGPRPVIGNMVYVDYKSGIPIVYTSDANIAVSSEQQTSRVQSLGRPVETQTNYSALRTYSWSIPSPEVGYALGPRLAEIHYIGRIDSCVIGSGATVTFNIEERTAPNSIGTDILDTDQVADEDMQSATSFSNDELEEGSWLYLDISGVSGSPEALIVTVTCGV